MLRIFAVSKDRNILNADSLADLDPANISWYWVDFCNPDEQETRLLDNYFHFHHLSVEDAVYSHNRPKLDYYEEYDFIIVNALNQATLDPEEVALFVGKDYIVSYHQDVLSEIEQAWLKVTKNKKEPDLSPAYIAHHIIDSIVDQFFPAVNRIEDYLSDLDSTSQLPIHELINEVFKIRGELLKLRRLVNSMRDLLYRIINSDRLENFQVNRMYFADIHDHLLKLSEMIESSREMTSDMRDSYLSINTNRMNTHMMILTVITTIFIPLTFIAGIYGMNFKYMPELKWRYGYFIILAVMTGIAIVMYFWFKRKGWFDN